MLSWVFPLPAFVLLLPVAVVVDPLVALTCPNAIAIGLGDESGDDVNEEIYTAMEESTKISIFTIEDKENLMNLPN